MIRSHKQELEAKRQDTRIAYVKYGFNSVEYNKQFEELHKLNMAFMHANFCKSRGKPTYLKSPYSEEKEN